MRYALASLLLAIASIAHAQETVGAVLMKDWRARVEQRARLNAQAARSYTIGFATGAMTALSRIVVPCRDDFTVGELEAYLRYSAPNTDTVEQAIVRFHLARGCYGQNTPND